MKYFLHEANAHQDEKIILLFIKHGYEGTGLYYAILERLTAQEKPINTVALKSQLSVGRRLDKIWQYLLKIDLISEKNDETYSKRLAEYVAEFKENRKKENERVRQYRDNQKEVKNNPVAIVKPEKITKPTDELRDAYKSIPKEKKAIAAFIKSHRPVFLEPYVDAWNLWAKENRKPLVTTKTDERSRKLATRVKEDTFLFVDILRMANESPILLESAWFTFDWIIKNNGNYLKVLEGNYKGDKAAKGEAQTSKFDKYLKKD